MPSVDDHFEELPFDPDLDQGADVAPGGSTAHPAVRHSQKAIVLAVGIGGVFGAVARYAVSLAIPTTTGGFPWSTFLINITGSAVLGALLVLLVDQFPRNGLTRPVVGTGVIGAYTTFSTFTYESVRLLEDGQLLEAAGNVAVSVTVGLGAAALGLAIGLAL